MASCTVLANDGADNVKPVKPDRRKDVKRIDGIVALIMALGRAGLAPRAKTSVYEERGILVL